MSRITRPALVMAACSLIAVGPATSAQESAGAALKPLVSIMELMQQTITPATNQLWSAYDEPSTPEEWKAMEDAAITLLAASSLVAAGGTGPMDNEWVKAPAWQAFDQAMIEAGKAALEASRKQEIDGLINAGDALLPPCEGCHQQFNPAVVNAQ